ncbi:hypothetical protein MVES1_003249 [Malassezia vespertilionis]|uniref:Conserved oligomeric Golgi complex subunit 8 n=1 Tax=Malassezia vespertilionis TaxID=2020962 RepID=A0A2N1J9E3_9BASI|nr:uncharacterized protein MVES1_003249 [Malassezia vespertilionis]PKI83175.1 hypothetical protein MVES_003086 [Malassezia vespertilionis]WFD07881.1 hypothetical protein MVES1_003249 [Malassezia vespertilionis]
MDASVDALRRLDLLPGADDASVQEGARYLSELAQMPLDVIAQQPAQQHASAAMLEHQLADLCLRNTSTFAQTQSALHGIPRFGVQCKDTLASVQAHTDRIRAAVAAWEAHEKKILAARHAFVQLEDTYASTLQHLLSLAPTMRACIARGHYDEALAHLADLCAALAPIPLDAPPVRALLAEVQSTLHGMHKTMLSSLCAPQTKLPQARCSAAYLVHIASLMRTLLPASPLAMETSVLCCTYLDTSLSHATRALVPGSDALAAVDAWYDAVRSASRNALSLFLDNPVDVRAKDMGMPIAAFAARAADALCAYVRRTLAQWAASLHADCRWSAYETVMERIAALHTTLCRISASLAHVGLELDMLLFPHLDMEHAVYTVWEKGLAATLAQARDAQDTPPCQAASTGLAASLNAVRHFAPYALQERMQSALAELLASVEALCASAEAHAYYTTRLAPWALRSLEGMFMHDSLP